MLVTLALLVVVVVFASTVRVRMHASDPGLGWMSERWLNEHRAAEQA
jgi:hypothetical protein